MQPNSSFQRHADSTDRLDTTPAEGSPADMPPTGSASRKVDISQPVAIARLLDQVSSFLEEEYVNQSVLVSDKDIYYAMRDTARRLVAYPWVSVSEQNSVTALHTYKHSHLTLSQAIEGMEELGRYFDRRDEAVREQKGLENIETGLSKYLYFAANHTRKLKETTSKNGPPLERGPFVVEVPRFLAVPTEASSEAQSHEKNASAGKLEDYTTLHPLSRSTSPHELRPHPHRPDHAPHVLRGSRHHSHYTAPEWTTFAEHPENLGKWVSDGDEHNTVQIGHSQAFPSQICEANFLGVRGVHYIKLAHPLCAVEIKHLDLDIIRFLRLMLEHRLRNPGPDESPTPIHLEWRSLELLKRELAIREWENSRLVLEDSNSEGLPSPPTARSKIPAEEISTPPPVPPTLHPLAGRRLNSRAWFEDYLHFVELIGVPKQFTSPVPEEYITIDGAGTKSHFVDASILGIPAVNMILMKHPLDANAVGEIDIDILKFLRVALWDWTNGQEAREDEKQSLNAIRRELGERAAERMKEERAAEGEAMHGGPGAKENLPAPRVVINPDPPTPKDTPLNPFTTDANHSVDSNQIPPAQVEVLSTTHEPSPSEAEILSTAHSDPAFNQIPDPQADILNWHTRMTTPTDTRLRNLEAEVRLLKASLLASPNIPSPAPSIHPALLNSTRPLTSFLEPIAEVAEEDEEGDDDNGRISSTDGTTTRPLNSFLEPIAEVTEEEEDDGVSSADGTTASDTNERIQDARDDVDHMARYIITPRESPGLRSSRGRPRVESPPHVDVTGPSPSPSPSPPSRILKMACKQHACSYCLRQMWLNDQWTRESDNDFDRVLDLDAVPARPAEEMTVREV